MFQTDTAPKTGKTTKDTALNSNQADKNRDTPQGRHATALQPINNWYQQTWHTIEFSNNRS
ncbi:hypothetical protein, partial [Arthrobacter sp. CAU 1506]|uniref:hypothetical protein n=1 Tax=Arthrobacter sp. CAU 1506 TaxID=2560052 RepID=UPI00197ACA52